MNHTVPISSTIQHIESKMTQVYENYPSLKRTDLKYIEIMHFQNLIEKATLTIKEMLKIVKMTVRHLHIKL
jgi:hypothetical protein